MEINSCSEYPGNILSNFAPNAFVLDGIHCASMEGFLQSLKFQDKQKQAEICQMSGLEAKKAGGA